MYVLDSAYSDHQGFCPIIFQTLNAENLATWKHLLTTPKCVFHSLVQMRPTDADLDDTISGLNLSEK